MWRKLPDFRAEKKKSALLWLSWLSSVQNLGGYPRMHPQAKKLSPGAASELISKHTPHSSGFWQLLLGRERDRGGEREREIYIYMYGQIERERERKRKEILCDSKERVTEREREPKDGGTYGNKRSMTTDMYISLYLDRFPKIPQKVKSHCLTFVGQWFDFLRWGILGIRNVSDPPKTPLWDIFVVSVPDGLETPANRARKTNSH